jgi:hypothetical protein
MAALIKSLDNYTSLQTGENCHLEYGWSNNIQEKIVQFNFQVTRTTEDKVNGLSLILSDLLRQLKYTIDNGTLSEKENAKGLLSVLYKIIGHTRDIIDGKGEYTLSYMMVHTWYKFYPKLAMFALKCFVNLGPVHQYGSWKDVKYFCEYCKNKGDSIDSELIQYSVKLMNEQIAKDYDCFLSDENKNISVFFVSFICALLFGQFLKI